MKRRDFEPTNSHLQQADGFTDGDPEREELLREVLKARLCDPSYGNRLQQALSGILAPREMAVVLAKGVFSRDPDQKTPTNKEVADLTGIPSGSVKSIYASAWEKLRSPIVREIAEHLLR